MSRNSQTRRLALSVAVALSAGGGALFPVMPHAFAADVSGHIETVDNPTDPRLNAPGISAGEINGWTNAGNVTHNTLTLSGVTYGFGNVHGGFTVGTGNVEGNVLYLKNGASINVGAWAVGGRTNNGGDATGNKIYIDDSGTGAGLYAVGGMTNGATGNAADNEASMTDGTASYLYGGFVFGANSTGNATGNKLTLSGGTVNRDVAGGVIEGPSATSQGTGNVSGSVVTISGGTVTGTTYGGLTQGIGSVTSNTVTVSGTTTGLHDVLGGRSMTGEVSGNILNFKEATADSLIGGRIAGTNAAGNVATNTVTVTSGTVNQDVRGGEILAPTANGNVSGNKVNINGTTTTIGGAVTAGYNMGTGNADGNEIHVTNGSITGIVTGGHSTQAGEVSGNTVEVTGGTLSDNIRGGFAFDGKASGNKVDITGGMLSGNTIVGGFSANGTAVENTATVGGNVSFTGDVMGGSAGAGADKNKVILKDNAAISGNAYGGLVGNDGEVKDNELTIESTNGATGDAVGGQNNAATGDVTDNKAYMRAGSAARLIGGVVNGVGASGKASGNRAEVSNGSSGFIAGALISDTNANGEVKENHADVTGASNSLGNIYGGITNGTGAATGNTAKVSGAVMVTGDVVGGQSVTGNAEGNKANFTQATVTNVRGARITGSGTASAINNEATIAGGSVTGAAAGAEIQNASASGIVQDNTLTVTGGTVSGDSYGGITYGTGDAVHNGAVVSGGSTILNDVYGGSSAGGNAKKNYVTYSEATAANLTGGRAQSGAGSVSDNKVEMTGGSVTNDVTGGLSYGSGTVEKNEVKIAGGTVNSGLVYGGQNIGTGAASSNTVELTGGAITANVYGGSAGSGVADSNKVTVGTNVTGNVFGGNAGGSASGNTVDLGAVTVSGSVVGGQGSTADNNTVNLGTAHVMGNVWGGSGSATSSNKVNMAGSRVDGVITVGSAGGSGNTLTVSGENHAGNITGFQSAIFNLENTVNSGNAMLELTNGTSTNINWGTLDVTGTPPTRTPTGARTLLSNQATFNFMGTYTNGGTFKYETDKYEYFIDTDSHTALGAKQINLDEYQFKGAVVSKPADPAADIWAGRSKHGNTTQNNELTITGSGSTTKNAYGGWTSGTGTTNTDQNDSKNNTVNLNGSTLADVYGGYTESAGGKATGNTVNVAGGNAANVVGGRSIGDATGNIVNVTANFTGDITGGVSTAGAASGNTINLRANVAGNVTGGQGTATNDNKVNLEGITVGGIISAGNNATSGNTLTVKGANTAGNITGFQTLTFNVESATAAPMLTLGGATTLDWNAIHSTGKKTGRIVLLQNTAGLAFGSSYSGAKTDADDTTEYNIDTDTHGSAAQQVISESYQFKGVTEPVSSGTPADVFGGISKVGNSTRENTIDVASNNYTNAYGGHTTGTGTAKDDKYNSYKNKITISGAAQINGTVYGGYTTSVNGAEKGAATQNEVNVTGGSVTNVVGAQSAGDATKNTVTIGASVMGDVTGGVSTAGAASGNKVTLESGVTVGSVIGGDGLTETKDNEVTLKGNNTVNGLIRGGTVTGATGNTLTVSGNNNSAYNIDGFQQLNFDVATADPANPTNPMLNLTNGSTTTLNWDKIKLTRTQAGRFVLLQNTAGGLSFNGTYTGLKTTNDANETTEFNIDTDSPVTPTQVISESYQFKDVRNPNPPVTIGNDVFGGISKVGNSTRENEITVSTGNYDNVYGGHTDGAGTAKADKDNSYKNKVKLSGTANINDTVYGGYTTAATGKTWENTVNIEGGSAAKVVGAQSAGNATKNTVNVTADFTGDVTGGISTMGIAEENTVNLDHVTVTGDVTGGQGATLANKNVVNMDNATVTGTVKAAATIGAGNTLTVKGTNFAGNIAGVQQVNFDASGASSGATLLTLTDGAVTDLDWSAVETKGTSTNKINLLTHTNANNDKLLHIEHYTGVKTGRDRDDTTEFNVDTNTQEKDAQHIVSESYRYRGQTERVEMDGNVYGGISKVGNATRENIIGVSSSTYTNAYGGYTDVPLNIGSDNAKSNEKGNSHDNTITISGSANIGTVYGGYTNAAAGTATKNTVNVTNGSAAKVVGAQSAGDAKTNKVNISGGSVGAVIGSVSAGAASENEITLSGGVTVDSVLGGQGTTTEKNKVNLEGATVRGSVKGGSAGGTGHELTVKRANTAGSIEGFDTLTFDVGTAAANPMLTLNGGASAFDWQKLEVNGTTVDPVTLMENEAGISFSNYDGVKSKINSADTTEFNIDTESRTDSAKKVVAQSYQYQGQTNAVTIGDDVYGGISKAANATRGNSISVTGGSHRNAYGGYTDSVPPLPGSDAKANSAEKNNSHDNTVTISGANVSGTVYGGYTNAAAGTATKNTVNVTGGTVANVVGGYSTGDAKENIVNVKSDVMGNVTGSVSTSGAASANVVSLGNIKVEGNVTGGQGTATNDNKVNVDGTTVNGSISGGSNADSGNTLTVSGENHAGNITGFQTVKFNLATGDASKTMLSLTNGAATNIAWASLKTDGTAKGARTLLSSEKAITLTGYEVGGNFVSETDAHEYFIDTDTHSDSDVKQINIDDYQFKGAKVSGAANSADTWAGRSKHGNTTQNNELTITDGTGTNAYGGWTSGTGTANADKNDSMNNTVNLKGGTLANVYGGYTTSASGKTTGNTVNVAGGNAANVVGGQSIGDATKNTVNVTANFTGNVTGGVSTTGAASRNVVNLGAVTVDGNVTGGQGVMTDDNVIHLNKTTVKGDVIGGSAASGKGNTLVVHPGASTARSLAGLQDVQFYIDGTLDRTTPLLSLTTKNQDLRGVGFGIGVIDGAQPALRPNDRISLIRTASDGTLQTDSAIRNTSKAMQGVSLAYEFDLAQTAPGELSATVASAKLTEQTKSLVETRAGATAFINQGTDFLVSNNIQAAKTAAAAEKAEHADAYALWAGLGASNMRAETGSYVESKGWNLGIGWAREHEMDAGKIVYGPFVSYGNGSYDSYLDDNTHGSGKFRTLGLGLMARVDQNNGMWFEGSLQGGRAKSDYSGVIYSGTNSEYDVSSTYWAGHFGVGKNIQLKENETINPYLRYFWSHQAGSNATLKNNGRAGESYEFSSVSSQRIRLGFRYTNRNAADGEFYAGLALEYEFDGSANASYQGYSTLRPSLKGSSGMLELGYRFAPKDSNVTYDFSLAGWQGKRRGLSGDLGVKWMF